ncbi:formylglycine-generating enzyme family protein [Myxococcota bacterium]|nr:formylglycine-generating enzyme family protein [Myxococcota bacterium]
MSPRRLSVLLVAAGLAGCDPNPGLDDDLDGRPCNFGEVKPCTCDDGRSSTATCGAEQVFGSCLCGQGRPGFIDVEPDAAVAPPTAAPTAAPRPPPAPDADAWTLRPPRDAGSDDEPQTPDAADEPTLDAAPPPPPEPDMGPDVTTPLTCARAPQTVRIGGLEIFRYEASHPLATATAAFPGAEPVQGGPVAPPNPADACSLPGVRPWHAVSAAEAEAACGRIGWRLCTADELIAACGGGERDWTFGSEFDAGACNVQQAYSAPGSGVASEAPTGTFPRCQSPEGVFDLTGNLWEWAAGGGDQYVGGGWRLIAEQHRAEDVVCRATVRAAAGYRGPDVGFRCCR